jgi:hypothetical protein
MKRLRYIAANGEPPNEPPQQDSDHDFRKTMWALVAIFGFAASFAAAVWFVDTHDIRIEVKPTDAANKQGGSREQAE